MTERNRNPAGQALFDLQFGLMMFNCGREEDGAFHLQRAQETLVELERQLDAEAEEETA